MLERTKAVIVSKNKVEKEEKERRALLERTTRAEEAYRAKLYENMKAVEFILNDGSVAGVTVGVPAEFITRFMRAIYEEEMQEFNIKQIEETSLH